MKYLIINHIYKETYRTNSITRDDLVARKNHDCDWIINIEDGTYFDPALNRWILLPHRD